MDKCGNQDRSMAYRGAAPGTAGDALAPRPGPAQPALDLSLGHFGTSDDVSEVDVVSFGPYTVTLDYGDMTVEVEFDSHSPSSRQLRRSEKRKVDRLVAVALRAGMSLVEGGTL